VAKEDLSLAPAKGSILPERAEAGISSRTTTSNTNALSPVPAEASLPRNDVSAPLPSFSGAALGAAAIVGGVVASRLGAEPLLQTQGVGNPVASGGEVPGDNFTLQSDTPLLYDTERGISLAQGNVTLNYGAFRATGRRGVVYLNATPRIAELSDNLVITARVNGQEQTFKGQALRFNLDTGHWDLTDIRATFPPDIFPPGQVLEPLFLRDGRVFGQEQDVGGSNFKFTSCDRDHYYLSTRQVNFYRDRKGNPDRIVLRHNALYVLGHKILELPNFVYSLQGQRSRRIGLQPQVGRNDVDGFFAKTVLDLASNAGHTDSLLVDTLQKRGLGLGFNRELANGAGLLYLYAVSGKGISPGLPGSGGREVDARVQREFNIGPDLHSSLRFDSSTNNTLAGAGRSNTNGNIELSYAPHSNGSLSGAGTTGNLQLQFNNSKDPFSAFSQRSGTLTLQRQFGSGWDASLLTSYNGNTSSYAGQSNGLSSDKQSQLDNTFALNRHADRFDAALSAELHRDLTGRTYLQGGYGALERLPELLLTTDSQRLGLGSAGLGRLLEGNFALSLGEYNEPSTSMRLSRTHFEFKPQARELRLINTSGLRSILSVDGDFGQNAYSDNTARYDYNTNVTLNTEVGRVRSVSYEDEGYTQNETIAPFQLRASYYKTKAVGYTPFQWDYIQPSAVFDARGIFQPSNKLRLEFAGGRDLQNNISRDLTSTLRLAPSQSLGLNVTTSYSLQQKQLSSVRGSLLIRRPANRFLGGSLAISTLYSPQEHLFSRIDVGADLMLGAKTRLQAFTSYNGFAKQFDIEQFRVVRDLHCFNLYASYDAQRKEFRFDLALKAFPFVDSRLGQTALGEGFNPAAGVVR